MPADLGTLLRLSVFGEKLPLLKHPLSERPIPNPDWPATAGADFTTGRGCYGMGRFYEPACPDRSQLACYGRGRFYDWPGLLRRGQILRTHLPRPTLLDRASTAGADFTNLLAPTRLARASTAGADFTNPLAPTDPVRPGFYGGGRFYEPSCPDRSCPDRACLPASLRSERPRPVLP